MLRIEVCSISSLHPGVSQCLIGLDRPLRGCPDTFLPFMKYWWPRVEDALFFGISERFSTALVHTLLCHVSVRL